MTNTNFNTSNDTFRKLIGNGLTYTVPPFQRDYSWTEDEWEDLWQDILDLYKYNTENSHYMGYLVLQSSDNKRFHIIDGQQRITTLSILVLAVLKNLKMLQEKNIDKENNLLRENSLRNTYIGYLNPVSLITNSKLQLNNHNNALYQNYMTELRTMPKSGLNYSEKLLKKGLEWFINKVSKDISNNNGAELATFIETISDKLFFTAMTVTDELNAFKVFETLNAGGVRLSSTDLLKNYLFSVVNHEKPHHTEIERVEKAWELMVNKLGEESFPDFLRTYWNSKNKLVRKADLFKTIKTKIQTKENVFNLIRELEDNLDIYSSFRNHDNNHWTSKQKKYVKELKMFNIKQPIGLLMSAYLKFNEEDFTKLLKVCSILSFRYNIICGLNPNEQESLYNNIACKIFKGELSNVNNVIKELKGIYPEDNLFIASFAEKELNTNGGRNKKISKYILFELEKQCSSGNDYDIESDNYTIEHIFPENPNEEWINVEKLEKYTYRLGNYTILEKKENKEIGNKNYNSKKEIYNNSAFEITKKIPQHYDTWSVDKIESRQRQLAKTASSIWKITFQ